MPIELTGNWIEQRNRIKQISDFVYHETNFILERHNGPKAVTVHNLNVSRYLDYHPRERVSQIGTGMLESVLSVNQVITHSEYIKSELLARFDIPDEKITAIPLAADAKFRSRIEVDCQRILIKYRLAHRGFLVVVGPVEPRKNLSLFIDSYSVLSDAVKTAYPNAHIGPAGWINNSIKQKLKRLTASGWFRSLGYAKQEDIPIVCSLAAGLAFPSIYEGFGLPPLEAKRTGIAVL